MCCTRNGSPLLLILLLTVLLGLLPGCTDSEEAEQTVNSQAQQPAAPAAAEPIDQPAPQPQTDILGYPGLEFGLNVDALDYTQLAHGPFAEGLYAYERIEQLPFGNGTISARLMYTALATEPGVGQVAGVVLLFDLASIEWADPDNPGMPAEAIHFLRNNLLLDYAPELIIQNRDTDTRAYLELEDSEGDRVWLDFREDPERGLNHLSLGYRSRELLDYRDEQLAQSSP